MQSHLNINLPQRQQKRKETNESKPMNELRLVTSETFGEVPCAFYQQDGSDEVLLTREQNGTALEYSDPRNSIMKIHTRHKERLDKFSVAVTMESDEGGDSLSPPSRRSAGGEQDTVLYTRKGVMEICRWSKQPKADAFMDFVWDIADKLIKGEAKVVPAQQPATPAMEQWARRVEYIADGLDDISQRLTKVERSTSYSNYYLRLQARSGYDRTWERRTIRTVKAIASYLGMEDKTLLRKMYKEMESRYGIVLDEFIRDYKRVKKITRCSTLSVISFSFPLREMFEAVLRELCEACKIPFGDSDTTFDLVDEVSRMVEDKGRSAADDLVEEFDDGVA